VGQSTGGQEIGTISAYVVPDWSAGYFHRQSVIVLNVWVPFLPVQGAESR
jgi:nitric oxide reductase large subunit